MVHTLTVNIDRNWLWEISKKFLNPSRSTHNKNRIQQENYEDFSIILQPIINRQKVNN